MTPRTQINIRDPFVLVHEGKYYLYGTRGPECWGDKATGLDCYVSTDLEDRLARAHSLAGMQEDVDLKPIGEEGILLIKALLRRSLGYRRSILLCSGRRRHLKRTLLHNSR